MAEPNEIQIRIFKDLRKELCDSIDLYPVCRDAVEVTTPFLDWNGSEVSIFITKDGRITDGGEIISQMESLRIIEDFDNWPFKLDFFHRYNTNLVRGCLEPNDVCSIKNVVKYIQGITRLISYFEPKPIYDSSEQFPYRVRKMTIEALLSFAPSAYPEDERRLWASEFTKDRSIKLNGIEVHSDMSPKRYFRMIQIFSHATSGSTDKRQHVESKILQPVLWKRKERRVEMYAIIEKLDDYAPESRALIKQESNGYVETCESGAGNEIARLLMEDAPASVLSN